MEDDGGGTEDEGGPTEVVQIGEEAAATAPMSSL